MNKINYINFFHVLSYADLCLVSGFNALLIPPRDAFLYPICLKYFAASLKDAKTEGKRFGQFF